MASVHEYMNTDVITLKEDMTLREATEILLSHSVSGAPVVDSENNLSGFITERDIISRVKENFASSGLPMHLSLFDAVFLYDPVEIDRDRFEKESRKIGETIVKDVMWKKVITVKQEDNIEVALYYLSKYRINRMPVLEDGKIVGIISRKDVLDSIFKIMKKEEPQ